MRVVTLATFQLIRLTLIPSNWSSPSLKLFLEKLEQIRSPTLSTPLLRLLPPSHRKKFNAALTTVTIFDANAIYQLVRLTRSLNA